MLLAETAAERATALEREKKVAWFTSPGAKPATDAERAALRLARDSDRADAAALQDQHDASRRVPVLLPHSAPLDWSLRSPHQAAQYRDVGADAPTNSNNNSVYPPVPKSSFDPLHERSTHRWTPAPSDFYPNTKTIIESRRGVLQQFRQLCYITLMRKRVEGRLDVLQRERGQFKKREQQQQQSGGGAAGAAGTSPTPTAATSLHHRDSPSGATASSASAPAPSLILGGLFDPLPNPSAVAGFALSRELKSQLERAWRERANAGGACSAGGGGASRGGAGGGADGGIAGSSPAQSKKDKVKAARDASKRHDGGASSAASGDATGSGGGKSAATAGSGGGGGSAALHPSFAALSSNLQLLLPLRIGDLETHPHLQMREPFVFRAQRMPRLPFPKHDYAVSGPQNVPLNFPAGPREVSETLAELPLSLAAAIAGGGGGAAAGVGAGRGPAAGVAGGSARGAAAAAAAAAAKLAHSQSGALAAARGAREGADRFALPHVTLETFEMPVVSRGDFRPPMVLSSGVSHVMAARDFAPDFYTAVPAAPLQCARPSPVAPRHEPLRAPTMQLVFAALPRTMAQASADDDLSDDEEHDLVDEMDEERVAGAAATTTAAAAAAPANNTQGTRAPAARTSAAVYLSAPPLSLELPDRGEHGTHMVMALRKPSGARRHYRSWSSRLSMG